MNSQKLALIGLGRWGKNLARNFHEAGVLSVVCDQNQNLEAEMAQRYGVQRGTFDAIINDESITQVAIATPVQEHYEMIKAALQADKDVWVEKPLCMSALETKELLDLASVKGKLVFVDYLPVYHPAVQTLKERLQYFSLKNMISIETQRFAWGVHRPEGVAWDLLCHDFALLQYLYPDMIMQDQLVDKQSTLAPPVIDTASVRFTCGKTKVITAVSCAYPLKTQQLLIRAKDTAWCLNALAPAGRQLMEYQLFHDPMTTQEEALSIANIEPLRAAVDHFLECCQLRQQPITSIDFAMRVEGWIREVVRCKESELRCEDG